MAKRFPTHRLRKDYPYSVEELADALDASVSTVRAWLRQGLERTDQHRPYLILGWQAREFLDGRAINTKRSLKIGEFFCLSCREPTTPAGGMADYEPRSSKNGNLQALCSACGTICNRAVNRDQLKDFEEVLAIATKVTSKA